MAKKKKICVKVVSQKVISDGIMDMLLETNLAEDACPGQFVGVYTKDKSNLLPRPISICEFDKEKKTLRLVYRIVGKGTAEFALYREGEMVDIIGILGNGFSVDKAKDKKALVIGGGIGVPPLLGLSEALKKENCDVQMVMGYRNSDTFLSKELENCGKLYIATEDGSIGTKGNVIDACRENGIKADVIYACGPMPMLKGVAAYAKEIGAKAYLSLEEKMACGVGACLGCICKTKNVDEHSHVKNARICTDGPVFDADDLDI